MRLSLLHIVGTGAGARWLVDQVVALRELGHEIVVVADAAGPLTSRLKDLEFSVHVMPLRGTSPRALLATARGERALLQLVRQSGFDLVHAHGHKVNLLTRLLGGLPGVPPVINQLTGDVHMHSRLLRILESATVSRADAIVASCSRFAEEYHAITARPVFISHYGLNVAAFESQLTGADRKALGLPEESLLVGMVAHMYPSRFGAFRSIGVKGHEVLLTAARTVLAQFPSTHFIIVGDEFVGSGAYRESLEKLAISLGIAERVRFLGHRDDAADLVAACDVVAVPSLAESASYAAIEAGLLSKPVIASDVGGLPDTVRHDRTGLLVPPRDPNALAQALLTLARDPIRRGRLGDAARQHCLRTFDVRVTAASIDNVYREVVCGAG